MRDNISLVALGSAFATKRSFREMGRGTEAFPFDWVRVSIDGLLHFLTKDFKGFFDYTTKLDLTQPCGQLVSVFRSPWHSFWHDDPTNLDMQKAYQQRIASFKSIEAQTTYLVWFTICVFRIGMRTCAQAPLLRGGPHPIPHLLSASSFLMDPLSSRNPI